MLNEWGLFLKSADSADVLNATDSGWFGPKAVAKMPHGVARPAASCPAPSFACG